MTPNSPKYAGPTRAERRRRGVHGVTLIEVLIVVSIIGLAVCAVASAIAAGILVWDQAKNFDAERMAALDLFEYLERDLRNSFPFYAIEFSGVQDEITFPGMVMPLVPDDDTPTYRLGEISYRFDEPERTIYRRTRTYPCESAESAWETFVTDVAAMEISYLEDADDTGNAPAWRDTWSDGEGPLPAAVKVELVLGQTDHPITMTRTVHLFTRVVRNEKNDEDENTDN